MVWRWHFYAGLITAPILWAVTITGALYVFRTELTEWRDRSLLEVTPRGERLSYDALRGIAARALGTDEIEAMFVRPEPGRSVRFVGDAEHEGTPAAAHRHGYIDLDPYSGSVLGTRVAEEEFFAVVLELHRSLLLGTTGRILTELATSWGMGWRRASSCGGLAARSTSACGRLGSAASPTPESAVSDLLSAGPGNGSRNE